MELGSQHPLPFGLAFDDLYRRDGLLRLDSAFLGQLLERSPDLHARLDAARRDPSALVTKQESELIVELAPYVEDFVGQLFGIEAELAALQARHSELAPLHAVKRKFVIRKTNGKKLERGPRDRRPRRRQRAGGVLPHPVHRDGVRLARREMDGGRGRPRGAAPARGRLRDLGGPDPGRTRDCIGTASSSRSPRRSTSTTWSRTSRSKSHGTDAVPRARRARPAPRGVPPDRPRHRPRRGARPGRVLHQVPQPGQG